MSSLASKLARLAPPGPVRPAPAATAPPVTSPAGPRLQDRVHGPLYRQGRVQVGAARGARPATVAALALDPLFKGVDAAGMLLLDTETTGLHGGSGTLPFVIGLAWFEGEALTVRQLFVPRPGHEGPLLDQLAERLAGATLLVTFNGKCFDWPLLRTRFAMNRIAPPPPLPHLDLLHCARRVWKRRLGATRLVDLEREVLGFERVGDLEGAEIPAVYFEWLRSGRPAELERVLEHNAHDLVSMAAVLAELCRRFDAPEPADAAEDCLGLARVAHRAGELERARQLAEAATQRSGQPALTLEACGLLARLAVQRREWTLASRWLRRATAVPAPGVEAAHLSYARVLEHGLKDFAAALHHARLATAAEAPDAHARRLERLTRRAAAAPAPRAPRPREHELWSAS